MSDTGSLKKRLTAGKACTSCKRRKNKCDGLRPICGSCRSRGLACNYPGPSWNDVTIDELKSLMEVKMREGVGTGEAPQTQGVYGEWYRNDARPVMQTPSAEPSPNVGSTLPASIEPTQPLRRYTPTHHPADHTLEEVTVCPPELTTDTGLLSSQGSGDQSNGYFGESSTFNFVSKVQSERHDSLDLAPQPKRIRLSSAVAEDAPNLGTGFAQNDAEGHFDLPPRHLADSLMDAYFNHVHHLYPFVHEPTFRIDYDRMWRQTPNEHSRSRPLWLGVLNMIFAHGCEFCGSIAAVNTTHVAAQFLQRARKIVYAHVFRHESLELVQALLLMSHYLQGTLELKECWSLVGLMIRTALSLGLHLNPSGAVESMVERELRKRVWWGCYVIDRMLSMKFGRPLAIQGAQFREVDYPLSVDDQYISNSTSIPRQPEGRPPLNGFFVQTIKLAKVIERILNNLYPIPNDLENASGTDDCTRDAQHARVFGQSVLLDGELLSWWANMPPYLRLAPELPDGQDLLRQRNVIYIRFLNARLLLHRQSFLVFSRQAVEDRFHRDVAIASCKCCISVARETINIICEQQNRRLLNSSWYILHYVFTSMGVLLTLQVMERSKLELLGETYDDHDLQRGMGFLKTASASSNLAARYVDMLQHIQKRPPGEGDDDAVSGRRNGLHSVHRPEGFCGSPPTLAENLASSEQPLEDDHGNLDFDVLDFDFDDLLQGTGLPRDLLAADWAMSEL